jgi:hypothetical protein
MAAGQVSKAAERELERESDLAHTVVAAGGDAPCQAVLGDGDGIVPVDRAAGFHSVLDIQDDFRGHVADGGGHRAQRDGGQVAERAVVREYLGRATIWHTGVPGLGLIAAAVALLQSSFSLGA